MALRLINKDVKRLTLGDEDWLDVRPDISKRQFSKLLQALPSNFGDGQNMTPSDTDNFTTAVFSAFVVDWSVKDENGNPVPVTEDNYLELTRESATIIDAALMEHFNVQSPTEQELTKSEEPIAKRR